MGFNHYMLAAVLFLGFCIVGDALIPNQLSLREDRKQEDRSSTRWWWLHGSRKILRSEVGPHIEEGQVARVDRLLSNKGSLYYPNKPYPPRCSPLDPNCIVSLPRPCPPYSRCKPHPPTPCSAYSRCRRYPPTP